MIKELLQPDIIKLSTSSFSSLVMLVRKEGIKRKFCVDYKDLNQIIVLNYFPMPIIEELIDELHGACIFSKQDLHSRYYQIIMAEEDISK